MWAIRWILGTVAALLLLLGIGGISDLTHLRIPYSRVMGSTSAMLGLFFISIAAFCLIWFQIGLLSLASALIDTKAITITGRYSVIITAISFLLLLWSAADGDLVFLHAPAISSVVLGFALYHWATERVIVELSLPGTARQTSRQLQRSIAASLIAWIILTLCLSFVISPVLIQALASLTILLSPVALWLLYIKMLKARRAMLLEIHL